MKEIENLKKEVKISNDKVEKLEGKKEKRRKNIILQWAKLDFIKRAKVEAARKLGQKTCLVELNSKGDKYMVMINKTKL
jgi:hypothetical protein